MHELAEGKVLTARHCIDDDPPERLRFGIGHDGWAPARIYEVASISQSSPLVVGDDMHSKGDVGVVTLTTPVVGIEPLPVAKLAPEHVGATFTVIGYGFSNPEETEKGRRKKGPSTLIALADEYLAKVGDDDDTVVCRGDSGSPLLQEIDGQLTVFGVAATTSVATGVCSNPATYQRFTPTECPGGVPDGQIACVDDAITRCDMGAVPGAELKTIVDCGALSPPKACIGKSCAALSSE